MTPFSTTCSVAGQRAKQDTSCELKGKRLFFSFMWVNWVFIPPVQTHYKVVWVSAGELWLKDCHVIWDRGGSHSLVVSFNIMDSWMLFCSIDFQ